MDISSLNVLADAISDAGSWWCWHAEGDMVQMEFRDVMLYDESKPEQEPHSTDVLAIRLRGHAFAVFLDNLDEDGWHERLRDDDSVFYPIDTYDLAFDDAEEAKSLLGDYENQAPVMGFDGSDALSAVGHLLCARCDEVGFVVGGDELEVVGRKGAYTGEEIQAAAEKWWAYWKAYWKLRGTSGAYPKDYVCEVTIPVKGD